MHYGNLLVPQRIPWYYHATYKKYGIAIELTNMVQTW